MAAHRTVAVGTEAYETALQEYYITLQTTEGCGERAQGYIDRAYDELEKAWNAIQAPPDRRPELPRKQNAYDDGTGGMQTGLANAARGCQQQ
jgi:hypothetical protein